MTKITEEFDTTWTQQNVPNWVPAESHSRFYQIYTVWTSAPVDLAEENLSKFKATSNFIPHKIHSQAWALLKIYPTCNYLWKNKKYILCSPTVASHREDQKLLSKTAGKPAKRESCSILMTTPYWQFQEQKLFLKVEWFRWVTIGMGWSHPFSITSPKMATDHFQTCFLSAPHLFPVSIRDLTFFFPPFLSI